MNSIADIGGLEGFGPINPEQDEPVFRDEWERRCFGMFLTSAAHVGFTVDEFRNGMESLPPVHYLTSTYYEHWIGGYEKVFTEKGVFTKQELEERMAQLASKGEANAQA